MWRFLLFKTLFRFRNVSENDTSRDHTTALTKHASDHTYSLSELCTLLRRASWEPVATYGNLATLQPMTPLTSMNIVAKAV